MVEDDDLGADSKKWLPLRVILGVRDDVLAGDILDRDVLDVEINVATGQAMLTLLVLHLHRLHFSDNVGWGEGDDTGLDDTSLDATHWHRSNIVNPVHIHKRETKGFLIRRAGGRFNDNDDVQKGLTPTAPSSIRLVQALYQGTLVMIGQKRWL